MKKNYSLSRTLILLFLISSITVLSQTKVIPYQELPTSTGAPSGSGIFFSASMTTSSITVTFEGPADRWFAIGFGTFMNPADVLMYSVGQPGAFHSQAWFDYYNTSSGTTLDPVQNWNIVSTNTNTAGHRTVTATRTLSTGDANDVAINFTSTALSLIWARGASADYTIAYHGNTNRAYSISLPWLSAPTASFTTNTTTVCAGSSITYSNITTGGLTSYTWSFAGGSPASSTSTNPSVNYPAPGTYSVVLSTTNAIGSSSLAQVNYITVIPSVVPSVSAGASIASSSVCSGTLLTFTANPTNGGSSPTYQWKVNNVNVGTNSPTFTTSSLANTSFINCVMTSNAVCASPATATSAIVTMTVFSSAPATVSVGLTSNNNPLCVGATAVFTASPGNGGTLPVYQWKINGVNSGSGSSTFTNNALNNGDVVTCVLNSNAPCASSTLATSSGITMTVTSILTPSVSVAINSGTNPLCAGSLISFSANPANGGNTPLYQWKLNGTNIGSNSPTFTSSILSNGAIVTCVMTSDLSCSSPGTATSAAVNLTVNPIPPTPGISPSGTVGLCSGSSLTLSSSASTGNSWSNNTNAQTNVITSPGTHSVTQTLNGCTSPYSSAVTVTANPQPTASLLPMGPFCSDSAPITLQGSPSGGIYSGPGITGNSFNPTTASVGNNLVVYTFVDANNCSDTAAAGIVVTDCSGIESVTNAKASVRLFPNPGTGVFAIESYSEKITSVRIVDLSGRLVFEKMYENVSDVKIDLSAQKSGVYIAAIKLESSLISRRITKQD